MTRKAMRSALGIGHPGTTLWRPLLLTQPSQCRAVAWQEFAPRVFSCGWEGFGQAARGLTVRLPFIAFPAGVNAEGVMVFVNARGTGGGATEGQIIEVQLPSHAYRGVSGARPKYCRFWQVRGVGPMRN